MTSRSLYIRLLKSLRRSIDPDAVDIDLTVLDQPVEDIVKWFERGLLWIDPELQRQYVWSDETASQLIESLILGMPVPPIITLLDQDRYLVIDGRQRIETLRRFLRDELRLRFLTFLTDLEGKTYSELPKAIRDRLRTRTLKLYVIRVFAPTEEMKLAVILEIFRRINMGSTPLPPLQAVVHTIRTPLASLVREVANSQALDSLLHFSEYERRNADNYVTALLIVAATADIVRTGDVRVRSWEDCVLMLTRRVDINYSYLRQLVYTTLRLMRALGLERKSFVRGHIRGTGGGGRMNKYVFYAVYTAFARLLHELSSRGSRDLDSVVYVVLNKSEKVRTAVHTVLRKYADSADKWFSLKSPERAAELVAELYREVKSALAST